MSVVGFDLGNLNCYIAVARQGGIEVLTNDYSLHATPSCVSFGPKNRTMGVAARQQVNTNIKNTIINFKQLVGRKFSDPISQKFIPYIPCEVVQLPDDNIGLKVDYLGEKRTFTPEQIVAILLVKLRDITETGLHELKRVTDCVVSVPFYFTDTQRRCLLAAVEISGLNCLRIVNETTAVALAYGIYKQDLPAENEPPRHVAFVDIGHSASQAVIVAYNKGKLAIIGATFDLEVGGLAFDSVLRDHFRKVFMETYKMDAASNPRAWLRLLDECEKLKKQMSANSTAIPINIECFMNDKDVTAKMQRADFEALAQPLFNRIRVLLNNLLHECGMQANQVDEVEIVGGSSRIPAVKKVIAEVFGKDPRTTMNQDEAVARGAAMQSAILSPSFRVREFAVKDSQPYRIKLAWGSMGQSEGGENDVFVERDEFPFSKMLTLYRQEPFQLTACYAFPNLIPHLSREIGQWMVKEVRPGADMGARKVKVKKTPESMEVDSSARGDQKNENKEGDAKEKEGKDDQVVNGPTENKPKTKTIAIDLPIEEHTPSIANVPALVQLELSMQATDRHEKEKVDAKNAVEEYVYYMRDKLADSFAEFITPKDADSFQSMLSATEDWLYDEGEDTEKNVYEAKLAELRKIGDPIQERHREHENRRGAFDDFDRAIIRARKAYEEYSKGSEKYAHIESKDMEKVISAVEEKKRWLDEQRGRQERHPKTDAPVIFVYQITQEQEVDCLMFFCVLLSHVNFRRKF
ncbi:unnamed protein product [Toxocara canis]|uniref:Heat shock 70 kDa protein 4L n=1 Tax=Toxocara canis TaxID=6265 RepID=A0A183UNE2_TOXCA|nr:unnamed protein product [Toxocara canis]